jgi:hypothetical protein
LVPNPPTKPQRTSLIFACSRSTGGGAKETAANADTELVALGSQFDALTRVLDATDLWGDMADALDRIESAILNTQAVTMEGLRVKARAACWARLGDLDPASGSTTDERMALSIIRDLIRLFDPKLEQPGALQKIFADFEQG